MKIDFKLERRIGALSENPSGYTKELNVVIWDEKYTKYDLRTWNPNGKPGKGITLTKEELKKLYKLIGKEKHEWKCLSESWNFTFGSVPAFRTAWKRRVYA